MGDVQYTTFDMLILGEVVDASMALYRKRTDASQRQWPEYEAWRQACAELAAFIGEGEGT